MSDSKSGLLRELPSVTDLLKSETVAGWLRQHPQPLVTECLRCALADLRRQILDGEGCGTGVSLVSSCGKQTVSSETHRRDASATTDFVLALAEKILLRAVEPHVREAINATGIILHTGLGRAVLPGGVVDSMLGELKGYCTLAVDRETGERTERDELVEYILDRKR